MSMSNCSKCGEHIDEMSAKGKYLKRTNPMGELFIGECAPNCEFAEGTQEDALLAALEANEKE